MSAKSNQLPDGFYVSRSKETSVLKAAANGHLSVWPSAQVMVAGSTAIFFKVWKKVWDCLLYTSPSPRDKRQSRMPSSA